MGSSVQQVAADDELPKQFLRKDDWYRNEGGGLFPTAGSLEWFLRKYRRELVEAGVIIVRAGPGGTFCAPNFGTIATRILRRESAASI